MTRRARPTLLALCGLAGLLLPAATPAAVYRCGNSYQQAPCPEGQAVAVEDSRSPEQRQAARATAAADQRLARQQAAERQAREKATPVQRAPLAIGPAARPGSAASASGAEVHPLCRKDRPKKERARCRDGQPIYVAPAAPAR